ncbi:MAG: UvrD-helicase domain-containing protein [Gammaproteobacteria bacterium]
MTVIDARQRQEALDISRSFIVQAPAGSGKTGVLTQRILKLLTCVERPEQILAITFTKKAAAEMRTRVAEALEQATTGVAPADPHEKTYFDLASAALNRDRQLGWNLLQNLGRLRLQTIDSLCSALVKENLLTAGLGAQFGIEDDASELYLEATRNLLASLDEDSAVSTALFRVLQRFENQFGKVQNLIMQMLEQRDHWLKDVQQAQQDWDGFRDMLIASLQVINEEAEHQLHTKLAPGMLAELDSVTCYAANNLVTEKPDHVLLQCEPGTLRYRKEQWKLLLTQTGDSWRKRVDKNVGFPAPAGKKKEASPEADAKERVTTLLDRFATLGEPLLSAVSAFITAPQPDLTEAEWQLLEDLVLIVRYAAAHLKMVFQQQHTVDFSEVALAALLALGRSDSPGDALLAMDEKISHILVDEFQDTSFLQIDLLETLTEGWTPGDGRTLFLVGDPMQSIYAFRKADVGLFLKLWHQQRLGQVDLVPLQLCMNFRSSRAVLEWVNTTFSAAFPGQDDVRSGAVRYAESAPAKPSQSADTAQTHVFIGKEKQQLAQAEADWIADRIAGLRTSASAAKPVTVAILVKGKSHILFIADALRKRDIRYQAMEIESLAESQVILDLQSLYQVCTSPGNQTAWFALLRGPWCGLSLLELEQVSQADSHPWLALQKLCAGGVDLSAFTREKLQHLRDCIGQFYQQRLQQPFAEAMRQLALDIGIPATANSSAEAEAMTLFFDVLGDVESVGGYPDAKALQKKLAKLFVPPEPISGDTVQVQIMTMHKSKGLEFDVVFLPQLHRKGRRDDKPLILVDKQTAILDEHQELFIAPAMPGPADRNSVYEYLWKIRLQRSMNEAVRLLYVACTRARKQLYLSACLIQKDEDKEPNRPDSASLFATVYPILSATAEEHVIPVQETAVAPARFRRPRLLPGRAAIPVTSAARPATSASINTDEPEQPDIHRSAGILLHRMLEVWARYPASIPAAISDLQEQQWRHQLIHQGHASEAAQQGAGWIRRALANLLANQARRHWLLEARHEDAHVEYALSTSGEEGVQHWIIDRTFVEQGIRHIIDYKLAEPAGDLNAFLAEETARYSPQLKNYREILTARDGKPCRTYLYFPLIDHLQEVET